MAKTYPFSVAKHGHDIEYYYNHLFCMMCDVQSGEIEMSNEQYDKLCDFLDGELADLYDRMFESVTVVYLTGKQIGLAKKIVAWAHEKRVNSCIEHGRLDDIQYC